MSTLQQLIDRARVPLNDADKVRYSDPELLDYAVAGLRRAYVIRPDLRFGSYSVATPSFTAASVFPLSDDYFQLVADYVTARAETKDDEHVNANRMAIFMQNFEKELLA